MNENDFYVAIQGVMSAALSAGWDMDRVHDSATDAADEWLSELQTEEFDAADMED